MKLYEAKEDEDYIDQLLHLMEQETGKEIFTMRILEHTENGLETLVVFADKNIMMGIIKVETLKGKMALRVQGNFI